LLQALVGLTLLLRFGMFYANAIIGVTFFVYLIFKKRSMPFVKVPLVSPLIALNCKIYGKNWINFVFYPCVLVTSNALAPLFLQSALIATETVLFAF